MHDTNTIRVPLLKYPCLLEAYYYIYIYLSNHTIISYPLISSWNHPFDVSEEGTLVVISQSLSLSPPSSVQAVLEEIDYIPLKHALQFRIFRYRPPFVSFISHTHPLSVYIHIHTRAHTYAGAAVNQLLLMATTPVETFSSTATTSTATIPRPRRVCFSFAAYAKNVIGHLKTCNVPIDHGLTDSEFSAIESTFKFTFPPDLRSILQEGLPVGLGFPNWRSSSTQQLQILTNLPILGICKQVSAHNFWLHCWGHKPNDVDQAVKVARTFLKRSAPFLVPIYRNCYIPSTPNLAGNPVFYVEGGDVRLSSFDVAGFFQQVDFRLKDGRWRGPSLSNLSNAPAWAATEARRIEFWTEMVERGESVAAAIGNTRGWWSGDLGGYLEEVCLRLKNGGWKEEEVREMMMMDGGEALDHNEGGHKEGVGWHVQILSLSLLRAGWSTEDVVDSLGCDVENEIGLFPDEESWFDFQHTQSCLLKVET